MTFDMDISANQNGCNIQIMDAPIHLAHMLLYDHNTRLAGFQLGDDVPYIKVMTYERGQKATIKIYNIALRHMPALFGQIRKEKEFLDKKAQEEKTTHEKATQTDEPARRPHNYDRTKH